MRLTGRQSGERRCPDRPDIASRTKLASDLLFDDCSAFAQEATYFEGHHGPQEALTHSSARRGSGKSALMGEIAVHSAAQIDWQGHRAKMGCGVVIFALERGRPLYKRRFRVYRQRDGLQGPSYRGCGRGDRPAQPGLRRDHRGDGQGGRAGGLAFPSG